MNESIVANDIQIIASAIWPLARKLDGKTVLISGGAGFIGSYMIATLQYLNAKKFKNPCKVISLDNYITGSPRGLLRMKTDKNIRYVKHNVIKPYKTRKPVDFIINAAGIASPIYYRQSPLETVDVTVTGLRNMLELARVQNAEGFLYFSSSEIYGNPDAKQVPTPETYKGNVSSIGPRSPYDESKRMGETLCVIYAQLYKMPIKIVRPFNVYGPGMKPTDYRVLPMFLARGTAGKPLPVHVPGRQTRTFCYISDAIIAFFKVLLAGKNGEVYNVGNDDVEISMLHLAKKVAKHIGGKVTVEKIPYPASYPQDEPQRRCPDLTKIRAHVSYIPQVPLDDGLRRFIAWFKDQYDV